VIVQDQGPNFTSGATPCDVDMDRTCCGYSCEGDPKQCDPSDPLRPSCCTGYCLHPAGSDIKAVQSWCLMGTMHQASCWPGAIQLPSTFDWTYIFRDEPQQTSQQTAPVPNPYNPGPLRPADSPTTVTVVGPSFSPEWTVSFGQTIVGPSPTQNGAQRSVELQGGRGASTGCTLAGGLPRPSEDATSNACAGLLAGLALFSRRGTRRTEA
jgi:hypothetical protein